MRSLNRNNREGMALALAMFAIVVIGALIAGAFFASNQDFKIGRNSLVAQRAFSAAEFGLNKTMGEWDRSRNMAITVGRDSTMSYTTGDGAQSNVRITRLNGYTYWLVSEGVAGAGTSQETRRRTSMVMRLAYPAVKVGGAVTLAGGGTVKGSAQVSGVNTSPAGWNCADYPGHDTTGVAYAPGTSLDIQKSSNVIGAPQAYADPNAGVDGNYIKYGDESWNTLVKNADVTINGSGSPLPVDSAGVCKKVSTNWGEPWRTPTAGTVAGCQTYFPIVYSTTDLQINQGRGQGILLVEGSLTVNGRFEWDGLIIVKNDINKGNGTPIITGAVMARNANISDAGTDILGNATFQYSKCALESAMRGSARLLPARGRAWAEMW
jgi:Tfp pilus assembly protein PilX